MNHHHQNSNYWIFVAEIIDDSNQSSIVSTMHPSGKTTLYQHSWGSSHEMLTLIFNYFVFEKNNKVH